MKPSWIEEFLGSADTLRVYEDSSLIFSSNKDRLAPLIDFLRDFARTRGQLSFLDRVAGNAAALLLVRACCSEVYSEVGSESAAQTLRDAGITFEFKLTVPLIMNRRGDDMCPMEKMSLGKTPEAFWEELQ